MTLDATVGWGIAIFIGQLAVLGASLHTRSYLSKKGENLATKEDVQELTRRVEEVRAEFVREQEKEKFLLARRLEEHRQSLQAELPIYRDMWDRLLEVEDKLGDVQVVFALPTMTDPDVLERRRVCTASFTSARDDFLQHLTRIEPFAAPEVYMELFRAMLVVRELGAKAQLLSGQAPEVTGPAISDAIHQTVRARRQLSDVIRRRMYPEADPQLLLQSANAVTASQSEA